MPGRRQPGPLCQLARPMQVDDGTMYRSAAPRSGPVGALANPVAQWSIEAKLLEAARRTTPKLPAESREQFAALFSPVNIGITGGVFAIWGASQFFGVGEVVDVVLLGVGVATMGVAAFGVGRDLGMFISIAAHAQTDADLEQAATHLARAVVTMGVMAFVALIAKAGSRLGGRSVPSERAAMSSEASLDLDLLTEEMLERVFGSTKNVGKLPRQNIRTIVAFFKEFNVENGSPAKWAELIKGIDLHAVEPVRVVDLQPGDFVGEYVETSRPANRQIGQWMVRARGVSHRNLGLSSAGREWRIFRVKAPIKVLESRAAPAADHWTAGGPKPNTGMTINANGQRAMVPAEWVSGGGKQYFLPRAWEFLEPAGGK